LEGRLRQSQSDWEQKLQAQQDLNLKLEVRLREIVEASEVLKTHKDKDIKTLQARLASLEKGKQEAVEMREEVEMEVNSHKDK